MNRPSLPFCLFYFFRVGRLTPDGNVSVDCGSTQTFVCSIPDEPIEWTTSGLREIRRGPFLARTEALGNGRITSPDSGDFQTSVSRITISGFSRSDNGGIIQCINANSSNVRGMASISVGEWLASFVPVKDYLLPCLIMHEVILVQYIMVLIHVLTEN